MGYEYSYGVEGGGEVDWCTAILLVHRGCGMEVMVSKSAPKRGGNDSVNFRVRIDCGFNEFFMFV
jgi:hypothetical protein